MKSDATRDSYLKTTGLQIALLAVLMLLAWICCVFLEGLPRMLGLVLMLAGAGVVLLGLAASAVTLWRDAVVQGGARDPFLSLNDSRSEARILAPGGFRAGPLRRGLAKALLGHAVLPGDEVRIRSYDEIRKTLDDRGMCEGMPFQVEMLRFCGQRVRVFRSVDKIYDYGRTRGMRLLKNGVLLIGLRCDGAAHGDCHALCYLIWHVSWLQPADKGAPGTDSTVTVAGTEWLNATGKISAGVYSCQYTALHSASVPLRKWSALKELRPLVAGNLTLAAFLVAQGTKWFNRIQGLRGGVGFPRRPARNAVPAPQPERLEAGDLVRVRTAEQIQATLNEKSKHAGLWFDRDMLKYCGSVHRVKRRIEQIIDDATGRMLPMKTACVVLEGVHYSGEFLNFSAQHDFYFWREVWLERVAPGG